MPTGSAVEPATGSTLSHLEGSLSGRRYEARSLVVPSAGNAGGALAAYGAAARTPVTVVMPADAPRANQAEVLACGGRLVLVEGLISDCGRISGAPAGVTGGVGFCPPQEAPPGGGERRKGLEVGGGLG